MGKIVARRAIGGLCQACRRSGKRLVFTNGCFDLLHSGHLAVFRRCRALGDVVIVGINDDTSVRRLKGNLRPILPVAERMALVAALADVDIVTSFCEDTPERLIRQIRPDVLVKGGDYRRSSIVGSTIVGRVVRVPLRKGASTTGIIDTIRSRYGAGMTPAGRSV